MRFCFDVYAGMARAQCLVVTLISRWQVRSNWPALPRFFIPSKKNRFFFSPPFLLNWMCISLEQGNWKKKGSFSSSFFTPFFLAFLITFPFQRRLVTSRNGQWALPTPISTGPEAYSAQQRLIDVAVGLFQREAVWLLLRSSAESREIELGGHD